MGPAAVVFEAQSSDGSSIVVASVTLPSAGFIAVHGDNGGSPGPVIGHSALLAAGTTTDVVVALDTPLASSGMVFPMAHIDVNGNGEYEFFPPDNTVDGPAQTDGGGVAVVGAEVTVEAAAAAPSITIRNFDFGAPLTVAVGATVTVRNGDGAPHTWTSNQGVFDSGPLGSGDEFSFVFDAPGEYSFLCEIHPSMTGSITVTG
jgi:plastocyanin